MSPLRPWRIFSGGRFVASATLRHEAERRGASCGLGAIIVDQRDASRFRLTGGGWIADGVDLATAAKLRHAGARA